MKIRQGFVSNSSSSSFCLYGVELNKNEFEKMILDKKLTTQDELDKLGLDEVLWGVVEGLEGKCVYEWDAVYLGRFYEYIGDNETGKEFRENTEKAIKELLGDDVECKKYNEIYPD